MANIDGIPFALPYIGKEEEEAVLRVLRSGWLTTAKEALNFENEFASFLQEDCGKGLSALAVNSATSGLHLALEACGVGSGDIVLLPTYTFAATAEVVFYTGAEPVFVDCAEGSFNIDCNLLEKTAERLAQGKTAYPKGGPKGMPKAVMPVHFGGLPCDIEDIMSIARRFNMMVIEDAAHAFPAKTKEGSAAGTCGDAGVFSFYATKTITTGEGGMLVTRNSDIAKKVELLRLHGIDRPIWNRYSSGALKTKSAAWLYDITAPGYKYNLCDILAAIGRVQLRRARDLLAMRKKIAAIYDAAFGDCRCFIIPPSSVGDARHLYPLRIKDCPVTRNDIIVKLKEKNIGASVHFIPLHSMSYYKNLYNFNDDDFPSALKNFLCEISLPIWPGMTEQATEEIINAVKEICGVC
ncbi:MAG: DegT/DnrJ/EryC1/StrS aminotransferase family protein [Spirochaetaceae bacterium]|nr:DegT/DnrJ/EryC1/StrS aminotransferase family protein [Spirochaetaceae bacterium]